MSMTKISIPEISNSFLVIFFMIVLLPVSFGQLKEVSKSLILMGTSFEISAVHEDEQTAWDGINAGIDEIKRIEKLISSWDVESQTSDINRNAGVKPVVVDKELYNLIYRCIKVSDLTNGAFDISFASMDRIWNFDGQVHHAPSPPAIQAAKEKIDYTKIELSREDVSVYLQESGMKIGFGGIGKGYAANRAKSIMTNMGIKNGVVNASGDLMAWGKRADGTPWKIGITDPKDHSKMIAWLEVNDGSVVTSGNYEKFLIMNGKRYAHIIDPRTGFPVSGIKSVTIVCPDPELGDALATAVFVMGVDAGMELINDLKGVEVLIVNDKDEVIMSDGMNPP